MPGYKRLLFSSCTGSNRDKNLQVHNSTDYLEGKGTKHLESRRRTQNERLEAPKAGFRELAKRCP